MDPTTIVPLAPVLQWGFAGFALLLLGVIVWLIRQLLDVLAKTNRVVHANTAVMRSVHETAQKSDRTLDAIRRVLDRRPCCAGAIAQELQAVVESQPATMPPTREPG